jgi:hypothetical protein
MLKKITANICFLTLFSLPLVAQGSFDLIRVDTKGKGKNLEILAETAKPLTDRVGYDNQPNFINDQELVFSAADDQGNHDIILYNFSTKNFTNLTKTSDRSEYSPSITDCKQYIAAVVVEPEGAQRLWLYPINLSEPELLYDDIEPVGYYDWYDNKAAMFVLGEPNTLIYARGRGDLLSMDQNIGRSVKRRPKTSEITYLSKEDVQTKPDGVALELRAFDLKTNRKSELGLGLAGSEDFIWVDKKSILMARGNEIFMRKINENTWSKLAEINLSSHQNISRMAYSEDLEVLILIMERNQ